MTEPAETSLQNIRSRVFGLNLDGRIVGHVYLDVRPATLSSVVKHVVSWITHTDSEVFGSEWNDGATELDDEDRASDFRRGAWSVLDVECRLVQLPADVETDLRRTLFGTPTDNAGHRLPTASNLVRWRRLHVMDVATNVVEAFAVLIIVASVWVLDVPSAFLLLITPVVAMGFLVRYLIARNEPDPWQLLDRRRARKPLF
jgi:hypothetical protein